MKRTVIFHPLLFALFPVVFLFAVNIQAFGIEATFRPAAKALVFTAAGWAALSLVLRNARKAAIITSLFVLLFYSFGHVVDALGGFGFTAGGVVIRPPQFVTAAFTAMFMTGAYFAARTKSDLAKFTKVLNFAAACLLLFPVIEIAGYQMKAAHWYRTERHAAPAAAEAPSISRPPSIFYIILDGYGRADNLKEIYGYDNQPFVDHLKGKGFYVVEHARTNYSHTFLSVSSSLNMEYLDGLAARAGVENDSSEPAKEMIRHSKVREFLAWRGYTFVSFASGFDATEIKDADTYLKARGQQGEFERGVANTTPALSDEDKSAQDRNRILYTFGKLSTLASRRRPLFVLAHIVAPHPPYVFDHNGQPSDISKYYAMKSANHLVTKDGITRSESMRRYIDQLAFVNSRMTGVLDAIIANSPVPPIIIVQGDHGPCCLLHHTDFNSTYFLDRMSILNAYYLPGGEEKLYDTITPVNTFRIVFDRYFDAKYELLADRSFYSSVQKPYKFIDVTDEIGSPADRKRYEMLKGMDYYPE
jgi:hypothetical protein